MDKNKAIIDYLFQCPVISTNPLFFNFGEGNDNDKQLMTHATDKKVEKPYIDGSVLKKYTFTIVDYRSIIYQALVNDTDHPNENVEELFDVQGIIDWISTQDDLRNYPNFGDDCVIDGISALTDIPTLNGVDSSGTSKIAKYSVSIQVEYLDKSKSIWK